LPSGDDQVHGFIYARGYLWATTLTSPAKLIRFNDLNNLNDISVITFAGGGTHDNATDLVYSKTKDRIYVVFNSSGSTLVSAVNPVTLAVTNVIVDVNQPTQTVSGGASITTDESFLYIVTSAADSIVLKYPLTTAGTLNAATASATLSGFSAGHNIKFDGTNLYVTGASSPAWIARVGTTSLAATTQSLSVNTITDDMAFAGDYVYVGSEDANGKVLRIKKSDL